MYDENDDLSSRDEDGTRPMSSLVQESEVVAVILDVKSGRFGGRLVETLEDRGDGGGGGGV